MTTRPLRSGRVATAIRRHPVASFVVTTYAVSWLIWAPWVLARNGIGLLPYELGKPAVGLVLMLGSFGPMAAALLVHRYLDLPDGSLLRRLVRVRAGRAAYLAVLVVIPLAVTLAMLVLSDRDPAPVPLGQVVALLLLGILSGPLGEEPGWRGLATPLLQQRVSPLTAAMTVGAVWTFWHLPQAFTHEWDTPHDTLNDWLAFVVFAMAGAVILAWVANLAAGHSLFVAVLGHHLINMTPYAVAALGHRAISTWPPAIGMSALALAVAIMTRGRLGTSREKGFPDAAEQ